MAMTSTMKPDGKLELHLSGGRLKGMLVLGFGAGGGIAAGWGLLELVSHDPKEGFALLKAWGPWALVVALAMLLVWKVATQAIGIVKVGVEAFLHTSERQATASEGQAQALTQLAAQGGRNAEEVRRLAIYAAQEFPSVYARLDRQDAMLASNHEATMAVHAAVERLAARLDETHDRERGQG